MTASARDARLLQTARRILEDAGRPLNVRRILRTGEQEERFEGSPSLEDLRAALVAGVAEGTVVEARRGIFAIAEAGAPAPESEPPVEVEPEVADEPEEADDKPRRRRRRREEPVASAETPRSLDEAAELSANTPDRDSLKGKLWERLRRKAAQVTEQAVSEASAAPVRAAEPEADDEEARPSEGRRRRRRRENEEPAAREEEPRRRREAREEAPAQPAKAEETADDDDPRAMLKARLSRRTRPSKAAQTESTPAPEVVPTAAPAEPAPEPAGGARALLRSRLAARLGNEQTPEAPAAVEALPERKAPARAEAEPPREPAEGDAPRGRRRRRRGGRGGSAPENTTRAIEAESPAEDAEAPAPRDVKSAVKARLAARLGRDEAPAQDEAPRASAPAAAAPAPTKAAPATGGDPRARLKARLAARFGDQDAPEPEAPRAAEPAPAKRDEPRPAGKGDMRSALKARLAARADATEPAEAPAARPQAPAAAQAQAPAAKPDLRSALKARLAARADQVEPAEAPAAPAAPAAKAAPAAPENKGDLRSALKARLAARGDNRADAPAAEPEAPAAPKAAPAPAASGSDPRAALKARLAARTGTRPTPVEPAAPATEPETREAPASGSDPRAALKARLAARRGPEPAEPVTPDTDNDPLDVPLAESRRPYREKRKEDVEPETERRAPSLPEVGPTSTLIAAALAALRSHGKPMSIAALAAAVDATAEGGAGGLRAALRAENGHRERAGLRPPFVAHYGGEVGLTEWGLSARYRALENQIQEAVAEQRELVRRDLLARVGDLTDPGFEQVMVMLLEQLGHRGVKVVHRQTGTVALTVTRDLGGDTSESIAVVARRSWGPIKDGTIRSLRASLANFGADSGLVVTVGTFAASARAEAREEGLPQVRLIDGAGLAGLLFDHGIGLSSHQPMMRYLDVAFFESLER